MHGSTENREMNRGFNYDNARSEMCCKLKGEVSMDGEAAAECPWLSSRDSPRD